MTDNEAHILRINTMICANATGYQNDGEVLVTPIGVLPRVAASLAMLTCNPDMRIGRTTSGHPPNPGWDFRVCLITFGEANGISPVHRHK